MLEDAAHPYHQEGTRLRRVHFECLGPGLAS